MAEEVEEIMDESEYEKGPKSFEDFINKTIKEYTECDMLKDVPEKTIEDSKDALIMIYVFLKRHRDKRYWYGLAHGTSTHSIWKEGIGNHLIDAIVYFGSSLPGSYKLISKVLREHKCSEFIYTYCLDPLGMGIVYGGR